MAAWDHVREQWPSSPEAAGRDTLFYAVCLAFFYKGQPDYPDTADAKRFFDVLTACARVDVNDEEQCRLVLQRLDCLPGIGLARASTILHCLHPDEFPIVDVNAAKALRKWAGQAPECPACVGDLRYTKTQMTQEAEAYLEYRRVLKALVQASRGMLSLRDVELGLYHAGREDEEVTGI